MKKIILIIIICLSALQGYNQVQSAFITFSSTPTIDRSFAEGVTKRVGPSGKTAFSIESIVHKVFLISVILKEWPSTENFYPPNTIDLDKVIPTFKSKQDYYNFFNNLNERSSYIYFFDKNDWKNGNYVVYQMEPIIDPLETW